MQPPLPEIVLFAGPNGAGKSTFARFALPEAMFVCERGLKSPKPCPLIFRQ